MIIVTLTTPSHIFEGVKDDPSFWNVEKNINIFGASNNPKAPKHPENSLKRPILDINFW